MSNIQAISGDQMRAVDEAAVDSGLLVMQMMEHAALNMARLIVEQYSEANNVLILAGGGHNGGDGIAATRFLKNWGFNPIILLAKSVDQLKEVSAHHLNLVKQMGIEIHEDINDDLFKSCDLIIDSLLGYAIEGDPRDPISSIINMANNSNKPIIAFDNPSGLNVTSGDHYNPCIKADITLTLALPKTGLIEGHAKEYVGKLYLADLGIPSFIYDMLNIDIDESLFKNGSIKKIQ